LVGFWVTFLWYFRIRVSSMLDYLLCYFGPDFRWHFCDIFGSGWQHLELTFMLFWAGF
jgi:hypothetical protein